jgi:nitrile hydratase
LPRVARAETVPALLARGASAVREPPAPARFAVGECVRTLVTHPENHTRLPRYARGRTGRIERAHGAHVFPDANAHGKGENPQWLYSVAFEATELWGADARAGDIVSLDLWEPYLEPARGRP